MKKLSIAPLCASVAVTPACAADISREADRLRPALRQEILVRVQRLDGAIVQAACCEVCDKGEPCGNSCINRQRSCGRRAAPAAAEAAGVLQRRFMAAANRSKR